MQSCLKCQRGRVGSSQASQNQLADNTWLRKTNSKALGEFIFFSSSLLLRKFRQMGITLLYMGCLSMLEGVIVQQFSAQSGQPLAQKLYPFCIIQRIGLQRRNINLTTKRDFQKSCETCEFPHGRPEKLFHGCFDHVTILD